MDRTAQLDELDSLKNIFYDEEFQVIEDSDSNEKIQAIFWAMCKLPDHYTVKYVKVLGSHESSYLKLSHLPPIELRLTFPEDYPSRNPPEFVISCQWLPKSKISLLCKKLDEIWLEYGPAEIVYSWCEFLKNDSLKFLNFENELDLRELSSKHLSFLEKIEKIQMKENIYTGILRNSPPSEEIEQNGKKDTNPILNECKNSYSQDVECKFMPGTSGSSKMKNPKFSLKGCNETRSENTPYSKKNFKGSSKSSKYEDRAVLDLSFKTSIVRLLENYNQEREKVEFLKNFYTCNICFSVSIFYFLY